MKLPYSIPREKFTIRRVIRIYCRAHHGKSQTTCGECAELLDYALARIDCCPFEAYKVPCADCTVHCYKPAMRDQIREVMRFAGPRMMLRHPLLAVLHMLHSRLSEQL